jgi:Mg2+-importing ATPase
MAHIESPARRRERPVAAPAGLAIGEAASATPATVLSRLTTSTEGLDDAEVARRQAAGGPNTLRTHRLSPWSVLARQLRSPLMGLLLIAATISFFVGQRADAVVIGVILATSVGLGFVNEYRAEQAGAALHDKLRHFAVVTRTGRQRRVDVVDLVPGDIVRLELGMVVPADLRLLDVDGLECNESVLTGESLPVAKSIQAVSPDASLGELACCALMGTVVRGGSGLGVVVATAGATAFGGIALGLGEQRQETEFQVGLRRFSMLLVRVAAVLTSAIFVVNLVLRRPLIDALLFSLAIAVGITPQLLPAVVSTSLAAGSRRLARRKVLVKRLICIEDLGDVEVLFTDKTGTLTEGQLTLLRSLGPTGEPDERPVLLGLLANEASVQDGVPVGGNPLDLALWRAPPAASQPVARYRRVGFLPFDHERRRTTALVDGPEGRLLVTKGAPEDILARCDQVPAAARAALEAELERGGRVVAVATRPAPGLAAPEADEEHGLSLAGLLAFLDAPKRGATEALAHLADLGVTVKVLTGDHPTVAARVCAELGLPVQGVLTGHDLAGLDDAALREAIGRTTVFARVSPDDKARLVRAQRLAGTDVAFLGDGVNDAVALHAADVGISVDTATDVARDAADVLLLEKDLGVLADGIIGGRQIFANTIKYVYMGTSSNFGNMFSAAGASAFLPFLPMLPSQLLLNNLLYDTSQLAIPTDQVDREQLARPSHWDLREIQRFMLVFGPLSSIFDFLTFAILLAGLHAGAPEFRSGWFVESLATQTLVVFVIRTHNAFWRSRPSTPLVASVLGVVVVATVLPYSPLASPLGFTRLPATFLGVLVVLVAAYLMLIEGAKRLLFAPGDLRRRAPRHRVSAARRVHRRAARFTARASDRHNPANSTRQRVLPPAHGDA